MRRWLYGPVLAVGWIVLCALFIQFFAGWRMVLALPPLSLAVIIIWVVLPALLIWGTMVVRSRAAEFAKVSARLADQLDRLYSPSEERDRRAHEALNALRASPDWASSSRRARWVAMSAVMPPGFTTWSLRRYLTLMNSGLLKAAPALA